MPPDWNSVGAIAQVVASLVSALSLVGAYLTLRREGARWREERIERELEREDNAVRLASLLVVQSERSVEPCLAHVRARNYGEQPFLNVRVRSEAGALLRRRSDEESLGSPVRRLEPGGTVDFFFETGPGKEQMSRPVVEFTDVAGRRWSRRGTAPPERVVSKISLPSQ